MQKRASLGGSSDFDEASSGSSSKRARTSSGSSFQTATSSGFQTPKSVRLPSISELLTKMEVPERARSVLPLPKNCMKMQATHNYHVLYPQPPPVPMPFMVYPNSEYSSLSMLSYGSMLHPQYYQIPPSHFNRFHSSSPYDNLPVHRKSSIDRFLNNSAPPFSTKKQ